jgi:hypothetical protein
MKLSEIIGFRRHGDYFEFGDKLIKMFHEGETKDLEHYEYETLKKLHALSDLIPQVYEEKEVDEHFGFVLEALQGVSLLLMMENEPSRMLDFAQIFAGHHKKLHNILPVGLKSSLAYFEPIIKEGPISDTLKDDLLSILKDEKLQVLCHGSFQPDKLIIDETGNHVIDFERAYLGHPASDIAMTEIILASPRVPEGASEFFKEQLERSRATFLNIYKSEYPIVSEYYKQYLKLAALVRLRDQLPGEEEWLLSLLE